MTLIGLVENILLMYVLPSNGIKNCFNGLLRILAINDNIFLIINILDFGIARVIQWSFSDQGIFNPILFLKILYPLNNIIATCSIFIIVVIAIERYSTINLMHRKLTSLSQYPILSILCTNPIGSC